MKSGWSLQFFFNYTVKEYFLNPKGADFSNKDKNSEEHLRIVWLTTVVLFIYRRSPHSIFKIVESMILTCEDVFHFSGNSCFWWIFQLLVKAKVWFGESFDGLAPPSDRHARDSKYDCKHNDQTDNTHHHSEWNFSS